MLRILGYILLLSALGLIVYYFTSQYL
jgi:hypothetical protein